MPATEPIQAGPYPEPSDAPDGPNQMAAIVAWAAGRLVTRFATPTTRDAAIPSPVEGMVAQTGTGATLIEWTYRAGTWQNTSVPGAWTAYTPTITGMTLSNGTAVGKWSQIGKTVNFRVTITFGSTSTMGALVVSLPVTTTVMLSGNTFFYHGGPSPLGWARLNGTTMNVYALTPSTLALTPLSPTVPFTWATGDSITVSATYETT